MKLVIMVPSMDMVHADFMVSVAGLTQALFNEPPPGLDVVSLVNERGSLIVQSRENLIRKAIEGGFTHGLFLDSDMKFPPYVVHRMLAHDRPIVGVNYPKRVIPATSNTVGLDGKPVYTTPESTGLQDVRSHGFGVTLIDLSIFENMERPWFDSYWMRRPDTDRLDLVGEDNFLFWRLQKEKICVPCIDHDISKEVSHIGTFDYNNTMAVMTQEAADENNRLRGEDVRSGVQQDRHNGSGDPSPALRRRHGPPGVKPPPESKVHPAGSDEQADRVETGGEDPVHDVPGTDAQEQPVQ